MTGVVVATLVFVAVAMAVAAGLAAVDSGQKARTKQEEGQNE